MTPAGVLLRYPWTLPAIVVLFVAMAFAAAVGNGALLKVWDAVSYTHLTLPTIYSV